MAENGDGVAIAGFVVSLVSIFGTCAPVCGLPLTITAIVLSGIGMKSTRFKGFAIAGLVIAILFLVINIANAAWGAYLGATGQHPLINF